eukprot:CAMPEP_0119007144 /NCGR_PEP_ID=MMETSP1176-20130426/2800_1 /TAXON_ID=265551 /ORGANISM="Synedropsis recta cf, Strain CCMP1620" /LENGTH=207 /DNA_ID=CAMNT_0006959219 /DNA_START=468 /DNA_END=1091 /DNA_ORIENTATION=-
MGSLLQCIRSCLEDDEEEDEQEQPQYDHNDLPPQTNRLDRAVDADDDADGENQCCRPTRNEPAWAQFWDKLTNPNYQQVATTSPSPSLPPTKQPCHTNHSKSPLRAANSFDASRDILTIRMEEIVLPGSVLQSRMADKMKESMSIFKRSDDECVICMESFSKDNPRMPTLCGCGENKTYFHLPCLYQWMEQSEECPSCRQTIAWEEF